MWQLTFSRGPDSAFDTHNLLVYTAQKTMQMAKICPWNLSLASSELGWGKNWQMWEPMVAEICLALTRAEKDGSGSYWPWAVTIRWCFISPFIMMHCAANFLVHVKQAMGPVILARNIIRQSGLNRHQRQNFLRVVWSEHTDVFITPKWDGRLEVECQVF